MTEAGPLSSISLSSRLAHCAIGSNRTSAAATWSDGFFNDTVKNRRGLLAYPAGHFVAVYDPANRRLIATLPCHSDDVLAVDWVRRSEFRVNEQRLVSGGADGKVVVWKRAGPRWVVEAELKGHSKPVTSVVGRDDKAGNTIVVSCSADQSIRFWTLKAGAEGWRQGLPLVLPAVATPDTVALQPLSTSMQRSPELPIVEKAGVLDTAWLIAAGCVDCTVRLFSLCSGQPTSSPAEGKEEAEEIAIGSLREMVALSGHENWIRCLSFTKAPFDGSEDVLLASASQDSRVRVWRLKTSQVTDASETVETKEAHDAAVAVQLLEQLSRPKEFTLKLPSANSGYKEQRWLVTLETVLSGHENWVTSATWAPCVEQGGTWVQPLCLLTSSMDKSIVVWQPERAAYASSEAKDTSEDEGIWEPALRLGEIGGKALGFYGAALAPDLSYVIAYGYQGGLYLWRAPWTRTFSGPQLPDTLSVSSTSIAYNLTHDQAWERDVSISGHNRPVTDVFWSPNNQYLCSVSLDRTARVWVPWRTAGAYDRQSNGNITEDATAVIDPSMATASDEFLLEPGRITTWDPRVWGGLRPSTASAGASPTLCEGHWFEACRPQVHGYELTCGALPRIPGTPHRLVSGAEEKVLRVYDASQWCLKRMEAMLGQPVLAEDESDEVQRAECAYVPELGLSNKGMQAGEQKEDRPDGMALGRGVDKTQKMGEEGEEKETGDSKPAGGAPPEEAELLQDSVWPEVNKLFGHGNELYCMANSHDGTVVVSACKARDEENAKIRVWSTETWQELQVLGGHRLTIVNMAWSPDDRFLVTVSKDRTFTVFSTTKETVEGLTRPVLRLTPLVNHKAHKRIIWSCAWAPDSRTFVTGSRDNVIKVWRILETPSADGDSNGQTSLSIKQISTISNFPCSITSLAFSPNVPGEVAARVAIPSVLAVGLDDGSLSFWLCTSSEEDQLTWQQVYSIDQYYGHVQTVRKILWRDDGFQSSETSGENKAVLVSCSNDRSLRMHEITLGAN